MKKTSTDTVDFYKKIFKRSEPQLEKLFFDFLRFQSISADPTFRPECKRCADWLVNFLRPLGFQVELWNKEDAPIVFATHMKAGPKQPTLLIYNHYDVQPVDPLDLWDSPPFEPKRHKDTIFARGAQDNKGQCFYVLAALKMVAESLKTFPINIKLCIEGEEESGSKALHAILAKKKKELTADYVVIVDLGMPDAKTAAITLGTRGLVACTVEIEGTTTDLHSGSHGGLVQNPLHALVAILGQLRDASGKVCIPGFYDDVQMPSKAELEGLNMRFDQKKYLKEFGALPLGGEKAFSPFERVYFRPTLELNGICGGYCGAGTKTVIPAKALAKISCRLVPHQDPKKIARLIKKHIESLAPKGIRLKCIIEEAFGNSVRTKKSSKIITVLAESCSLVYKKPCQYIYEGASIPITAELAKISGAEVALFGLGLATDKIHAPNEHFTWGRVEKGAIIIATMIEKLVE